MTAEPTYPGRISEILRLTATLCDHVLDAQIMGRPVPEEQVRALAKAARLLREDGVDWPPMLTQALHGFAQSASGDEAETGEREGEGSPVIQGLSRLLGAFRRDKSAS